MNIKIIRLFFTLPLVFGICAATTAAVPESTTDQQRIDSLIKQNQLLVEMITGLKAEGERPKTAEELFAVCMQAAKGSNAMAAESIGGHCNQLLKK